MPRGPCSPETASLLPAGQRPRGCRSTRPGGGAWPHRSVDVTAARRPAGCFSSSLLCPGPRPGRARASRPLLHDSTVPGPAAGPNPAQPAFPPRSHCARARRQSDLGPVGLSSSLSLCPGPRPGRTRLGPYTTPAGGRAPAGRHLRRAATPADGRTQIGRCGVLTRILVGAAAAAGPGRPHPLVELAGPDLTTRHGDVATATSSCRLLVPLSSSCRGQPAAPSNVILCTL